MGGNAGVRGYIIQTLICVLDSLQENNEWESVTLEPLDESEKVDIKWEYKGSKSKLSQVKSSQNLISYKNAEKWSKELESHSPDASEYELLLIGPVAQRIIKTDKIGKVKIGDFRALNIQSLIDQASTKIDAYYEKKGKEKLSTSVRELIVKSLCSDFGNSSIVGASYSRKEFDDLLLRWIGEIERQLSNNPFAALAPPVKDENVPINKRIAKKILKLIGWDQFGEEYKVNEFNERTEKEDSHIIDFEGDIESKLIENTLDYIMVSALHDVKYPSSSKSQITKYINTTDIVFKDLQKKKKITTRELYKTNHYALLFWLTTDNNELSRDFIYEAKDNYKKPLMNAELNYFLVDSKRASFLVSSIITATNFRPDVPVKFFYPITEANQHPTIIGQRGLKLPVQYINSSILPIVMEDKSRISFLLFCSDTYSNENLKKLLWLIIRLTSGLGNQYVVYFPDYDETQHGNDSKQVIRSFDDSINHNMKVLGFKEIETEELASLPETDDLFKKNESYNEEKSELSSSENINEAFIDILPYGDILKPFLNTEAITAKDMQLFLAKKGIYLKKADKSQLISLMSTLLFSPSELEDFKSFIEVKEKKFKATNEHYILKNHASLDSIFEKINPNFENLSDNLNTKVVNSDVHFHKNENEKEEFTLTLTTEIKDPTKSLSVNTTWGKVEIKVKKVNDQMIVATKNTITKDDKYLANKALKILHKELMRCGFVEEDKINVMFNSFDSNSLRVNFMLSFSEVTTSSILTETDVQSITFKFDDDTEIPVIYKDKADKDLIIKFEGKDLSSISELSASDAKESIYLEEIRVRYKFDYMGIKNGECRVVYNFSGALKNKPEIDGAFNSEFSLVSSKKIKSFKNVELLKKKITDEVEKLKIEKLRKFGIIQ